MNSNRGLLSNEYGTFTVTALGSENVPNRYLHPYLGTITMTQFENRNALSRTEIHR